MDLDLRTTLLRQAIAKIDHHRHEWAGYGLMVREGEQSGGEEEIAKAAAPELAQFIALASPAGVKQLLDEIEWLRLASDGRSD